MGALTEIEIFDCLATNFRLAAEHCDELAVKAQRGPAYDNLRTKLRLIEGACRQASVWREDTRWLPIGRLMAETHQKAGSALRGVKMPDGTRIKVADGQLHPFFTGLAENLRALHKIAEDLRTKATGRLGVILPQALPGPHRDTRPVTVMLPPGMARSAGGILLPGA